MNRAGVTQPMMTLHEALAWELRVFAHQRGWSQRMLASHLGLHQSMVSSLYSGKRHFTLTLCERMAALQGISMSRLMATCEVHQRFHTLDRGIRIIAPSAWRAIDLNKDH